MAVIQDYRNVTLASLSGTIYQNSSSFSGANYHIALGPIDVSLASNFAITLINNHATNRLESGSVEFSPNNSQWETDWNTTSLAGLAANGGVRSMQVSSNSRKWLRVRVIPSGSGGQLTGSIDAFLHVNNG